MEATVDKDKRVSSSIQSHEKVNLWLIFSVEFQSIVFSAERQQSWNV